MTTTESSSADIVQSAHGSKTLDAKTSAARALRPTAATLEMVAAEAGVSRSTVSRVVNGSPKVRPDVVDTVNAAISRLNYVPNRAARSLASRQTYAIALLVPEVNTRFFGDPYFAAVVKGITSRLDDSDYILNLLVMSSDPARKTMRYLQGGNVDGAIVVSHHSGDRDLVELSETLPLVFGGRPTIPDVGECYFVDVDNFSGAVQATQRLVDLGRKRIGTITGAIDMPASIDRLAGWEQVMNQAQLATDAVADGDFSSHRAEMAMRELLNRFPDLDAVFVASDLMARGAMVALAERGKSIPGDIALVGYDDSPAATSGEIKLTTVSQPSVRMGAKMADMLLELLADREPNQRACIMETRLVIRESA